RRPGRGQRRPAGLQPRPTGRRGLDRRRRGRGRAGHYSDGRRPAVGRVRPVQAGRPGDRLLHRPDAGGGRGDRRGGGERARRPPVPVRRQPGRGPAGPPGPGLPRRAGQPGRGRAGVLRPVLLPPPAGRAVRAGGGPAGGGVRDQLRGGHRPRAVRRLRVRDGRRDGLRRGDAGPAARRRPAPRPAAVQPRQPAAVDMGRRRRAARADGRGRGRADRPVLPDPRPVEGRPARRRPGRGTRSETRRGPMTPERWTAVDQYITDLLVHSDPALDAALADSAAAGLPAINVTPTLGKLLHILALVQGARTILEVGTLGGYSTIWLARALPPG